MTPRIRASIVYADAHRHRHRDVHTHVHGVHLAHARRRSGQITYSREIPAQSLGGRAGRRRGGGHQAPGAPLPAIKSDRAPGSGDRA